ncbi:lycopene cyclase domain-containing protein [bacterium]|nr:lycopene cyclase domain-containing protein [bacterium]
MTYTTMAIAAAVLATLLDLIILKTRLLLTRRFWMFFLVMLPLFFVVNGVLTSLPVVRYAPEAIIGVRLWTIPIEDIAYMFSLLTPTIALYEWLQRRRKTAV